MSDPEFIVEDGANDSLRIKDEGHAFHAGEQPPEHVELLRDFLAWVHNHRERNVHARCEAALGIQVVGGDPDDLDSFGS